MRIISFLFLVAASPCLPAAQTDKGTSLPPSPSAGAIKEGGSSLSCTISVRTLEWHEPHPVEVSVVLENQSKAELNVPVVPSFDLEPLPRVADPLESQWRYCEALWDLEKGTTLPVSSMVPLHLKPSEPRKITSNISELLWTRLNWSVLPCRKLFSVVPAGRYSLHLKLTSKDGKTLCSSNAVEVLIK